MLRINSANAQHKHHSEVTNKHIVHQQTMKWKISDSIACWRYCSSGERVCAQGGYKGQGERDEGIG